MTKRTAIQLIEIAAATGIAASTATGIVALARGDTKGAPGITRALSRLGKSVGGSMLTGIALASAGGAATALVLYAALQRLGPAESAGADAIGVDALAAVSGD